MATCRYTGHHAMHTTWDMLPVDASMHGLTFSGHGVCVGGVHRLLIVRARRPPPPPACRHARHKQLS